MAQKTMRERKQEAAKRALDRALQALNDAQLAVGAWADSVSQEAEERLGVDVEDPRRLDDAEYAGALDVVGRVHQAQKDMEHTMRLIDWRPST